MIVDSQLYNELTNEITLHVYIALSKFLCRRKYLAIQSIKRYICISLVLYTLKFEQSYDTPVIRFHRSICYTIDYRQSFVPFIGIILMKLA